MAACRTKSRDKTSVVVGNRTIPSGGHGGTFPRYRSAWGHNAD
nr:MAG TPA: hypothetical protein [Caudoviricetes sp.]